MGDEPYFIDVVSNYIEDNVLSASERDFNQTVVYGRDVDLLTVLSFAKRYPMMSDRQVVIVKEAQNLKGLISKELGGDGNGDGDELETKSNSTKNKKNKASKNPFMDYLEQPMASTILVFCYKYKTLDKRTALSKAIAKNAVLFESKQLYENKIPDWINTYLKDRKLSIHVKASQLLVDYLGKDLGRIAKELDKLKINLHENDEITVDHIQTFVGINKEYNQSEFLNALGKKDVLKANRIANYFAENQKDNHIVLILANLFSFFNKLMICNVVSDRVKLAQVLGVNPYFLGDYEKAAKNYSLEKLKFIFSVLREYDLKSKGVDVGNIDTRELLKELVFKILH